MASGYALPSMGGSSYHGHSHSYSGIHLSPSKPASNAFPISNGNYLKKAVSNNSLYTHAETSRETSPISAPHDQDEPNHSLNAFDHDQFTHQQNGGLNQHRHHHSWSPMKSRPRGESDLGRPANPKSSQYRPVLDNIPAASTSWFSLPEALTSLLIPLPCVLASTAYSSMSGSIAQSFPPLSAYAQLQEAMLLSSTVEEPASMSRSSGFIEACILTSSTLLLVGVLAKMQLSERTLDRRKGSYAAPFRSRSLFSASSFKSMATRALSVGLPYFASMQLGGMRTGLVLLMAVAADLTCTDSPVTPSFQGVKDIWSSKVATSAAFLLSFITDEVGLTIKTPLFNVILGYIALTVSTLILQPPLPRATGSSTSSPRSRHGLQGTRPSAASPLTCSVGDTNITLTAGVLLAVLTVLSSMLLQAPPIVSASAIVLSTLTVASMACTLLFSLPSALRSESKAGLAFGCLTTASCSFLFSPSLWPGTVCNGGLSALSFLGVLYDTNGSTTHRHSHAVHDHAHNVQSHHHHHHQADGGHSAFTKFVLSHCEPGSLVSGILSEKDSRRIAYFTILNFGFMIVQGAYGYLSGSLGLLSDTVHMFFDCLGLVVGLGAAVASKWPNSPEKPYGWGKLNTLSGFGNGIFLMLVSVEFVWEAIESIIEGSELRHVQELLVVSTLGLVVNLIGLFAFGHAHAGHDHGHGHSHLHSHSHGAENDHNHANGHIHGHHCDHDHDHNHKPRNNTHGDAHEHNDNMHGIFLHVAADAGGSLAVIISTALTLWKPWYLWDPLATIIIAILIFAAAVPLVISSGQKLLLIIPDDLEYNIKTTLQDLHELRGVVGYAAPKFWIDDTDSSSDPHDQHHHHGHEHGAHRGKQKILGVVHVIAAPPADLDEVRERVEAFFASRNMDLVIHVEREADGPCWCGGATQLSH